MNTNRAVSRRSATRTHRSRTRDICLMLCTAGLVVSASAGERQPPIISFDAPGAGATPGAYQGTGCFAYTDCSVLINARGDITGYYLDANNVFHGFLRTREGKFTSFDAPGADTTPQDFNGTLPTAINDAGAITGWVFDASGGLHGFLRSHEGSFTTFDVPNGSLTTSPIALNAAGEIAGFSVDQSGVFQGFLRRPDGTFKAWIGPGACDASPATGCYGTGAVSINASGAIAGGYEDNSGNFVGHGLIRSPGGKFTSFSVPGGGAGSYQGTGCPGCNVPINQSGVVGGYYVDANNVVHAYLRSPRGEFTTFDAPAGASTNGFGCFNDCSLGLNDSGATTGSYLDANNVWHGFVRSPDGRITTFDPPGADLTPGSGNGTFPVSINNEGAITGYYLDANEVNHGFVRLPPEDD